MKHSRRAFISGLLAFVVLPLGLPVMAASSKKKLRKPNILGGKGITGVVGGFTALTSQECVGLGGSTSEAPSDMASCKSNQVCRTADQHGVIRIACIDEVAQ